MPAEQLGNLLGGRADIDKQGRMIRYAGRHHMCDLFFFLETQHLALGVGDILGTGGQPRAAMIAVNEAFAAQEIDIAADGLGRDLEMRRQMFDGDKAFGPHQMLNFCMPFVHRADFAVQWRTAIRMPCGVLLLVVIFRGLDHSAKAF